MNYIAGDTIRRLREGKKLTQRELAERLCVSDKTVSKWETGRGLPDITILPELGDALGVSVPELLTGQVAVNRNVSANMKRSVFAVCPVCGNVIHAMGEGAFSCCGIRLPMLEEETAEGGHGIVVENVEDELYVHLEHPMEREHYISFLAYVTDSHLQMEKLYPEQGAATRFRRKGPGKLLAFCNRHGLFSVKL
ncbi:MAG: helix-turn-helix domain-containing protein [bacterium]|nr:helix-turn-helix domain-containing protein [bacterium]